MKKILFCLCVLVLTSINQTALASTDYQSTKDIISQKCSGYVYQNNFLSGSNCTGERSTIYYLGEMEVTKAVFEKEKKVFEEKGSLCTETIKTKTSEMPIGTSVSCVKGEYGTYFVAGKKVSYSMFVESLTGALITQLQEEGNEDALRQLKNERKLLKSMKTFLTALKSSNEHTFSFSVVGSPCIGNGGLTIGGDGYANSVCEKGILKSVEYILNDETVSFDIYVKTKYKAIKQANQQQIKNLTKKTVNLNQEAY